MKFVQACSCTRKNLQSSFHHDGTPVDLVHACLAPTELENQFLLQCRCYKVRNDLFQCRDVQRKQF